MKRHICEFLFASAIICPQSRICKVNRSVVQGNNTEKVITNKSKCRIALHRNAALSPVRPNYLGGKSGSYGQNLRFCTLIGPHPTISTLFYISIHCHVSILSGILSRGIGFDVSVCYIAFWRVHLMGMFFIDRFELGEACICTLCAVKYKGGVSNGMWDVNRMWCVKTRTR